MADIPIFGSLGPGGSPHVPVVRGAPVGVKSYTTAELTNGFAVILGAGTLVYDSDTDEYKKSNGTTFTTIGSGGGALDPFVATSPIGANLLLVSGSIDSELAVAGKGTASATVRGVSTAATNDTGLDPGDSRPLIAETRKGWPVQVISDGLFAIDVGSTVSVSQGADGGVTKFLGNGLRCGIAITAAAATPGTTFWMLFDPQLDQTEIQKLKDRVQGSVSTSDDTPAEIASFSLNYGDLLVLDLMLIADDASSDDYAILSLRSVWKKNQAGAPTNPVADVLTVEDSSTGLSGVSASTDATGDVISVKVTGVDGSSLLWRVAGDALTPYGAT